MIQWTRRRLGALIDRLTPPADWVFPVVLLLGSLAGLFVLVLHVSRATSYLSDDPATCVNCHVMAPQYGTWFQSAHRIAATCNDCHVPHDNKVRHYGFKASDGMRHAFMFTFRLEPQVIRIHPAGQRVVQENCVRCHAGAVHTTRLAEVPGDAHPGEAMRCWGCHTDTPHGDVRGLASVPYEHVPLPSRATPGWLRALMSADPDRPQQETPP